MTEACGAEQPPLRDYGWTCTGRGLIVVMRVNLFDDPALSVVLPARALEVVDPEPWWDLPVVPFAGGNHVHLMVPRLPPPGRIVGNGVLLYVGGGVAYSLKAGTVEFEEASDVG